MGTLTSWNPLGHSRPVMGLLYLPIVPVMLRSVPQVSKLRTLGNFVSCTCRIKEEICQCKRVSYWYNYLQVPVVTNSSLLPFFFFFLRIWNLNVNPSKREYYLTMHTISVPTSHSVPIMKKLRALPHTHTHLQTDAICCPRHYYVAHGDILN